jgi:hypothetical protein
VCSPPPCPLSGPTENRAERDPSGSGISGKRVGSKPTTTTAGCPCVCEGTFGALSKTIAGCVADVPVVGGATKSLCGRAGPGSADATGKASGTTGATRGAGSGSTPGAAAGAAVVTGGTKSRLGRAGPGSAAVTGKGAASAGAVTAGAGSGSTRGASGTFLARSGGTNFRGSGRAGFGTNATRFGSGTSCCNKILGAGCQTNCLPGCDPSALIVCPGRLISTFGFPVFDASLVTAGKRSFVTYQISFSSLGGSRTASSGTGCEVGIDPMKTTSAIPPA